MNPIVIEMNDNASMVAVILIISLCVTAVKIWGKN